MNVRKDIVAVSIPFTSGIALAAASAAAGIPVYVTAGTCTAAAAAMLSLSCREGPENTSLAALYILLGAICWFNCRICGNPTANIPGVALRGLDSLDTLIDSTGFADPGTTALLKALLTGQRGFLDHGTVESFRRSGASHILALSGLHLGIIYSCIAGVLRILGNGRAASFTRSLLSVLICGFYVLMTGAAPSTVRALIFICLNELARQMPGRRRDPLAILCTALTLQLCISPSVISSVGFQLSYLAMLGIFTLAPVLQGWYPETTKWDPLHRIWSSIALTVSCQAFTAPLVWFRFHTFPKYFLLTNLIALPVTELLMVSAAAAIALSAAGICPTYAKSLVDILAQALIFCLEVISGM